VFRFLSTVSHYDADSWWSIGYRLSLSHASSAVYAIVYIQYSRELWRVADVNWHSLCDSFTKIIVRPIWTCTQPIPENERDAFSLSFRRHSSSVIRYQAPASSAAAATACPPASANHDKSCPQQLGHATNLGGHHYCCWCCCTLYDFSRMIFIYFVASVRKLGSTSDSLYSSVGVTLCSVQANAHRPPWSHFWVFVVQTSNVPKYIYTYDLHPCPPSFLFDQGGTASKPQHRYGTQG